MSENSRSSWPSPGAKGKQCTYCTSAATTDDHIPPRCLFPTPPPRDLITVPSCQSCNNGSSQDDEYFRSRLVSRADVAEDVSAQEAVSRLLRSFRRPQTQGFTLSFARNLQWVDLVTPAGDFVGPAPAFAIEQRLSSVPSRIVKGLFFHHSGQRLAKEYGVRSFPLEQIQYSTVERRAELERLVAPVVTISTPRQIGGAFTYWYSSLPEDLNASAWVMLFYGKAWFIAFTEQDRTIHELERRATAESKRQ